MLAGHWAKKCRVILWFRATTLQWSEPSKNSEKDQSCCQQVSDSRSMTHCFHVVWLPTGALTHLSGSGNLMQQFEGEIGVSYMDLNHRCALCLRRSWWPNVLHVNHRIGLVLLGTHDDHGLWRIWLGYNHRIGKAPVVSECCSSPQHPYDCFMSKERDFSGTEVIIYR